MKQFAVAARKKNRQSKSAKFPNKPFDVSMPPYLACQFFDLDKSYWNKRVMDGSISSMDVTAGGKMHRVIVHHYAVTRFSSIVGALNTALEK